MANEKDKGVVDLTKDAEYEARLAAAKSGRVPVGGVPMPPIPRFDQAPPDRSQGVQSVQTVPGARPIPAPGGPILTPQQQQDLAAQGQFIPGVGAAYAANQPGMAKGVPVPQQPPNQSNEFANPPRPEGSGLRPETVQQLEAVAKANASQEEVKANEELKKTVEEMTDADDGFDYDNFGRRVRSLLNNKERREAIAKRCDEMSIEDLITQGEVRQTVPIVPNKFFPTFRSVSGTEDLFVKRLMSGERGSDQYILDKFSIMNLACGLFALNGKPLPTHLDQKGDPDEKLFDVKFRIVMRMALPVLADLSTNYTWFGMRLEKLFVVDNIKGF